VSRITSYRVTLRYASDGVLCYVMTPCICRSVQSTAATAATAATTYRTLISQGWTVLRSHQSEIPTIPFIARSAHFWRGGFFVPTRFPISSVHYTKRGTPAGPRKHQRAKSPGSALHSEQGLLHSINVTASSAQHIFKYLCRVDLPQKKGEEVL